MYDATLGSIFNLLADYWNGRRDGRPGTIDLPRRTVTTDDVRGEMRRYLTASSPDAKAALAKIATALPEYTLGEDGTAILVDTDDKTAPDGYGRTYYLTLTEIPR